MFAASLCACVALLTGCHLASVTSSNQRSPEDALKQFYNSKGPEETVMDPLIIAGDKVVPLVLKEVENKNMPRRRYAIHFLGNGSYKEALPLLKSILQDPGEEDYFRGDALISIYLIDESLGREYAQKYLLEDNNLGRVSHQVLEGYAEIRNRRSYLARCYCWKSRVIKSELFSRPARLGTWIRLARSATQLRVPGWCGTWRATGSNRV